MKTALSLILISQVFFFPQAVRAQSVQVIDVSGEVLVKKEAASDWQKAKLESILGTQAQVQTKQNSECTLAFDEERANVMTIKENSLIRIENVAPGKVNLSQGRVFTVIKNLSKAEKFQVRTPTAIAAARGTGWSTGFDARVTEAVCFEDVISVEGLDEQGNTTGITDVPSGSGVDVGEDGAIGDMFSVRDSDVRQWDTFTETVQELGGGTTEDSGAGEAPGPEALGDPGAFGDTGSLDDARQENKQDLHDQITQDERANEPVSNAPVTSDPPVGQNKKKNKQ